MCKTFVYKKINLVNFQENTICIGTRDQDVEKIVQSKVFNKEQKPL